MSKSTDLLSPQQLFLHGQIKYARNRVMQAKQEVNRLIQECPHFFKPLTEKQLKILRDTPWKAGNYSSASCLICGEDCGWRCPDSPDGVCHYHTNNNKVELVTGTLVDPPEDWYEGYAETDDDCLYCHYPDERK